MKKYFILSLLLSFALLANSAIKLPAVIGSNMVLQRNSTPNIWGFADANSKLVVTTSWNNKKYKVVADKDGRWIVPVETQEAGGPYTITIKGSETIKLENILLGEVWISSGQSNMEMPVCGFGCQPVENSLQAILEAPQYSNIRMFTVKRAPRDVPQDDCEGAWLESTPSSVASFSAVAYFYAKELNKALNVPIGIITSNWGGSTIEPWMSKATIEAIDGINQEIALKPNGDNQTVELLYNGMIHPIINYTAKGFIWYQGESNRLNPADYAQLMDAMVKQWRADWKNEKMSFYFAQMAPYTYEGVDSCSLALLWDAQYEALKMIPNSGMAPLMDLGYAGCIHPSKKIQVGQRFAILALGNDYGMKGFPGMTLRFKGVEYKEGKATVELRTTTDPNSDMNTLDCLSYPILGFEIAGADQKFYKATSVRYLWGQNKIELGAKEVKEPIAVRYSYHNVPDGNIHTIAGIPLLPFRTDSWSIGGNK